MNSSKLLYQRYKKNIKLTLLFISQKIFFGSATTVFIYVKYYLSVTTQIYPGVYEKDEPLAKY
jgi:hypothetical protein